VIPFPPRQGTTGTCDTDAGPPAGNPPVTAALAVGPGGTTNALAVASASLIVYQLTPAGTWNRARAVTVPIQYGSSS
jgi:hypothetical protein